MSDILNEYFSVLDQLEKIIFEGDVKEDTTLDDYKKFISEKLTKYGVKSVNELAGMKKVLFFEEVEQEWKQSKPKKAKEVNSEVTMIAGKDCSGKKKRQRKQKKSVDKKVVNESNHCNYYREDADKIIKKIKMDFQPKILKIEHDDAGFSVLIKDMNSKFEAWLDYYEHGIDVVGEWNQYIFILTDEDDCIQKMVQEDDDVYESFESAGFQELIAKGLIIDTGNGYKIKPKSSKSIEENLKSQIDIIEKLLEEDENPVNEARKVTSDIINYFLDGENKKIGNTESKDGSLLLFGNKIAKIEKGNLSITNAGYATRTTKERLNGLPNVKIVQKDGIWYLNGKEWDGDWIKIGKIEKNLKEKWTFKGKEYYDDEQPIMKIIIDKGGYGEASLFSTESTKYDLIIKDNIKGKFLDELGFKYKVGDIITLKTPSKKFEKTYTIHKIKIYKIFNEYYHAEFV
jgi:hypothetical protein